MRAMRPVLTLVLGTTIWLWASCAMAQDTNLDAVLTRLEAAAADVQTISARFTQHKHLSMFEQTLTSTGRFAWRRPDGLRWEYLSPVAGGFALNGTRGRRWDDLSETSQQFDLRSNPVMRVVAQQLMAWASFDIELLRQEYAITLLGEGPVRLQLVPTREEVKPFLHTVAIVFAKDERVIEQVRIVEADGDWTRIEFSDTQLNSPLSGDLF